MRRILGEAERWYLAWRGTDAPGDPQAAGLRDAYLSLCATIGRGVRVELPAGKVTGGTATDLDADGRLVVGTPDGEVTIGAGDVRHVR